MSRSPKTFWQKHSITKGDPDHPDHAMKMEPIANHSAGLDMIRNHTPADKANAYFMSRFQGMYAPGGVKLNPTFLPSYISNLVLWWSSLNTGLSDSQRILRYTDLSGNNNNLIAVDVSAPVFSRVAFNGMPAANMLPNKRMAAAFVTVPQPLTMFFVSYNPNSPINDIYGDSFDTSNCFVGIGSTGVPGYPQPLQMSAGSLVSPLNIGVGPHILCVVFNGASSFARLDGVQSANVNPGAGSLVNGFRLGTAFNQAGAYGGFMAEGGIYSKALSTLEFQQLESLYIGAFYNIKVA